MVFYYPSVNEEGWKCTKCGEKLGFRPDLDRQLTFAKVDGLLCDLYDHDLVYVSNGTERMVISENVTHRCEKEDRYDQSFIIYHIVTDPNVDWKGHSDFWKEETSKVLN